MTDSANADSAAFPTLWAEPLTAAAFAPFGSVVDGSGPGRAVNEGRALRHDGVAGLVHDTGAVAPVLAVYAISASAWPVANSEFERHRRSAQLFVPMAGEGLLAVVAPDGADGGPDVARARAFVVPAGTGIVYAPGTWHVPLVALGAAARCAMLMWETGTAEDCEVRRLPVPLRVLPLHDDGAEQGD
jgi:ureidoglycolate lyase